MSPRATIIVAIAALAGCAPAPSYRVEVVDSRPLPRLATYDETAAFGITVDPDEQVVQLAYSRYGSELGLVDVPRDGSITELRWTGTVTNTALAIVAMGHRRYGYVGYDGGYVLDTSDGSAELRFCLVPGDAEGRWPDDLTQRSMALAYDVEAQQFWTQPRTYRGAEPVRSQLAVFDAMSGDDLQWWTIDDTSFRADAMVRLPDGRLLLADWTGIHAFDPETALLAEVATLEELDAVAIGAMALDPVTGHVLALDMAPSGRRVIELAVTRLD